MKFAISSTYIFLAACLISETVLGSQTPPVSRRSVRSRELKPRRTTSILINPAAHPDLPPPPAANRGAAADGLNLDDIQGDILVGMKKRKELFFFFHINDAAAFKTHLAEEIHPRVTSTRQLLSVETQPDTAVNIAFSHSGLTTLNVDMGANNDLDDDAFATGQAAGFAELGDASTANWIEGFKGRDTHGVLILASDTVDNVNNELASLLDVLGGSISERHRLQGAARPGNQEGHEHFGYMDGISQPAVEGFDVNPRPGQISIEPGIILLSEAGDTRVRPEWAKDGSFLAFRQLKQRVPEFDKFLRDNPLDVEGLTPEENSDLLGARMIGRWKSGAPIDLSPRQDNLTLANDPDLNNDFTFAHPDSDISSDISRCPFSAHIRKTKPRADLGSFPNHIIRAGIPYGPEVTDAERTASASDDNLERGLAFVAYQAQLRVGFIFMQQSWANNAGFIFGKNDSTPGVDPIIGVIPGQTEFDVDRPVSGLDPVNPDRDITLDREFVVSRGGEYFFSPSISSILGTIAA